MSSSKGNEINKLFISSCSGFYRLYWYLAGLTQTSPSDTDPGEVKYDVTFISHYNSSYCGVPSRQGLQIYTCTETGPKLLLVVRHRESKKTMPFIKFNYIKFKFLLCEMQGQACTMTIVVFNLLNQSLK